MKWARFLLFALLLVFLFGAACAESIVDFSAMTDEELLSAQQAMNDEIISRGLIKKVTIPAGVYEAGVDIPTGKYIVSPTNETWAVSPQVAVFECITDYYNRNVSGKRKYLINQVVSLDNSVLVTLNQGYVLYLMNFNFTIEPYSISVFN